VGEAVADAGPLIHLDEAGLGEALHIFRRITASSLGLLPSGCSKLKANS
jgi:hypothetical protein